MFWLVTGGCRKQLTFCHANTGFLMKWRLGNNCRNSIVLTCYYYQDMGSTFDWLKQIISLVAWPSEALPRSGNWHIISMEFLCLYLRDQLTGNSVVALVAYLWNVGCFLKLGDQRLLSGDGVDWLICRSIKWHCGWSMIIIADFQSSFFVPEAFFSVVPLKCIAAASTGTVYTQNQTP